MTDVLVNSTPRSVLKTAILKQVQSHYIEAMVERFGLLDCNGVKTLRPKNIKLSSPPAEDSAQIKPYQAAVGMLNFLSVQTCPDIACEVSHLGIFNLRHNGTHWAAVKHLL